MELQCPSVPDTAYRLGLQSHLKSPPKRPPRKCLLQPKTDFCSFFYREFTTPKTKEVQPMFQHSSLLHRGFHPHFQFHGEHQQQLLRGFILSRTCNATNQLTTVGDFPFLSSFPLWAASWNEPKSISFATFCTCGTTFWRQTELAIKIRLSKLHLPVPLI